MGWRDKIPGLRRGRQGDMRDQVVDVEAKKSEIIGRHTGEVLAAVLELEAPMDQVLYEVRHLLGEVERKKIVPVHLQPFILRHLGPMSRELAAIGVGNDGQDVVHRVFLEELKRRIEQLASQPE